MSIFEVLSWGCKCFVQHKLRSIREQASYLPNHLPEPLEATSDSEKLRKPFQN